MLIRVDECSSVPLYAQIAGQIRRAIASGEVVVGDRLPAARQLADSLDVNMHTVLRALSQLRDEGLVDMRRGRGVTIVSQGAGALVAEAARAFVAAARDQGLSDSEIRDLVEVHL
jgi:DNA-binding transcriptional regulator YhcF (GntR family)